MSESDENHEIILDTKPKPFVFVLMPFDTAFTDVYRLGIKTACEKAGAYAERLDEQLFDESMLQRIYNQIVKADVIVADMTGRNPNVFYEVGYAHALGKVVILLTKEKEDIPFDLKHYRHIVYENVSSLLPQLETAVRWGIKHSGPKSGMVKPPIVVYCEDRPLADRPRIVVKLQGLRTRWRTIQISLTYSNADQVNAVKCKMALWTSELFNHCSWREKPGPPPTDSARTIYPILHPARRHVFACPMVVSLLPGEWRSDVVSLKMQAGDLEYISADSDESMILRTSTESGSYDYPFTVKFEQGEE